jgi:hypothetical protein
MLLTSLYHIGRRRRQGAPFRPPLLPADEPEFDEHRGKHKLINFYINLLNLLNRFDGSIRTSMRKAAHPSGGVGSSNPCRWRGERLHHHGDGVCLLFVLFVASRLVVVTCRM